MERGKGPGGPELIVRAIRWPLMPPRGLEPQSSERFGGPTGACLKSVKRETTRSAGESPRPRARHEERLAFKNTNADAVPGGSSQ